MNGKVDLQVGNGGPIDVWEFYYQLWEGGMTYKEGQLIDVDRKTVREGRADFGDRVVRQK